MSYEGVGDDRSRWSLVIDLLLPLPLAVAACLLFHGWAAIAAYAAALLILRWVEGWLLANGWRSRVRVGAKLLLILSSSAILPFAS